MYLAGVLVRRVEGITEALWCTRVVSGTVSNLNKKVYQYVETWRKLQFVGVHPYVYLDGFLLKRSLTGEVKNVSVLIPVGFGLDGYQAGSRRTGGSQGG